MNRLTALTACLVALASATAQGRDVADHTPGSTLSSFENPHVCSPPSGQPTVCQIDLWVVPTSDSASCEVYVDYETTIALPTMTSVLWVIHSGRSDDEASVYHFGPGGIEIIEDPFDADANPKNFDVRQGAPRPGSDHKAGHAFGIPLIARGIHATDRKRNAKYAIWVSRDGGQDYCRYKDPIIVNRR